MMTSRGFSPERLRRVIPKAGDDAKFILAAARKGDGRPMETLPPLVLHDERGDYTAEVNEMIRVPRQD